MHTNGVLLERLYSSLDQHLPGEMAKCYDASAIFRDIAFDLQGKDAIESRFRFRDGLITEHLDDCDAKAWADAAIGGVGGFLAERFRFLRAWKAKEKLKRFETTGQKG